jgi:hypothetical protein
MTIIVPDDGIRYIYNVITSSRWSYLPCKWVFRHNTIYKRYRIPKWQSKMDNPEKLARYDKQNEEK